MLENNDEYINITFSYSEMREWEDFLGDNEQIIPLYTHPVKDKPHPKCDEACMYLCRMRELTDEEIMEIVADKYEKGHGRYIDTKLFFVEFAKAILRKAQEK